jgi:hypothetical protein
MMPVSLVNIVANTEAPSTHAGSIAVRHAPRDQPRYSASSVVTCAASRTSTVPAPMCSRKSSDPSPARIAGHAGSSSRSDSRTAATTNHAAKNV